MAGIAQIKASSEKEGFEVKNIVSGVTRQTDTGVNMWSSDGISENGENLEFSFEKTVMVSQISMVFDTNFNYSIKQTQNSKRQKQQRIGVPPELVKDYNIKMYKDNQIVFEKNILDNHQRLNVIDFEPVNCDKITIDIKATNGCEDVHIYEVRIY